MAIVSTVRRWFLVTAGCFLLSSLTWGQAWGPRAAVRVEFGAPVRFVQVERRWDDLRWNDRRFDRERVWREQRWRDAARNGADATVAKSGGSMIAATSYLERAARQASHGQCSRRNGHE